MFQLERAFRCEGCVKRNGPREFRALDFRMVAVARATMCQAGIVGPMCCPKGLRHGFGMRAASRNVPTNLIQRWMGHASATTTAIYLDAVGAEERRFASRMW
jgi:integrase